MKSQGLNQFFRIVWNAATGTWQAVAESAKGRGKTKSSRSSHASRPAALLAAGSFVLLSAQALAADLPTGGNVVAGAGSISQSGSSMTVNQSTGKMAVDWQSFSIGQGNTVTFNQPSASAVALNRVLGSDVSVIQGALKANGQVFLVNPNGVLFTPTAQVNVGSLVASTLNMSTADFMTGNYKFDSALHNAGEGSAVINQGNITAVGDGTGGGTIALIAAKITNTGTLTADKGNVLLGAGSKVTLDMGGPVKLEVTQGALETLIANGGAIRANGGTVLLTSKAAGDLAASVINNTGLIEAQSLATGEQGEIILFAHGGTTNVEGTLDATGGFVETSGQALNIPSTTAIKAAHWLIDPTDIVIESAGGAVTGASVSASAIETYLSGTGSLTLAADNDVTVNQAINWSANTLTLSAGGTNATGSVYINANMTATGAAGLALNYGASGNVYVGMNASGFKGKVDLSGTSATTVAINSVAHTIIKDRTALAAVTGTGKYVVGNTIDLSVGGDWTPLADFEGVFDGLGNTISNLTNSAGGNYRGLFGASGQNFAVAIKIRNVGVVNANITNAGTQSGILIGSMLYPNNSFSITNTYTTGSITGNSNTVYTTYGGLVGASSNGSISNSFSTASVTGGSVVGGLIGVNSGTISNSYATGAVTSMLATGDSRAGGFVGNNQGPISNSYSAGLVVTTGSATGAGGFAGRNADTINNSFWNISTSGRNIGSGTVAVQTEINFLGKTTAEMQTLATYPGGWNLTGSDGAYPTLTGKPSSAWYMDGATSVSYTLAALTGTYTYTGNAYSLSGLWSSPTAIFGSSYSAWALGTDYEFKYSGSPVTGFTNAGAYTGISVNILKSGFATASSGNTSGSLTIAQAPLTVTASNATATYNASAYAGTPGVTYSGFVNSETSTTALGGTLAYGYSTASPTNAGSYTITPSGYTAANYALTYNTGTLTIDPKALTITGLAAQNKTYDGLTAISLTGTAALSGVEAGDTSNVTLSGTAGGQVASANAGTAKAVSVGGLSLAGSAAGNYTVGAAAGLTANIDQRAITVVADAKSKTFGDADPSLTYQVTTGSLIGSDNLGTLTRATGEAAGSYTINASALANGNYLIAATDGTLTISAAPSNTSASAEQTAITVATQTASQSAGAGGTTSSGSGTLASNAAFNPLGFLATTGADTGSGANASGGQRISGGLALVDVASAPPSGQQVSSTSNMGGPISVFLLQGGINFGIAGSGSDSDAETQSR